MTDEQVVAAIFDAFARRDLDAVLALFDPEAEIWPQGTAERVDRTKPYRGHDGLRRYLADVEEVWEDLQVEPGELRSVAGSVVAFGTARGTPRTGPPIEQPVIWTIRLRHGRVTRIQVVATAAEAERAAREQSAERS